METSWFNCLGHSIPIFSFADRRAAGQPITRWMPLASVERVLYGGSTGAIHRLLGRQSLSLTVLSLRKESVTSGLVTAEEHRAVLSAFAETLELDARGRVRNVSLLPLPVAVQCAKAFGRSNQSTALLECLSAPRPRDWVLEDEQQANDAAGEVDYVLDDELQELQEADVALQNELHASYAPFEAREEDEVVSHHYTLTRVPGALDKALARYKDHRVSPLNRMRDGSAVVELTVAQDRATTLRFLGWLHREHGVPPNLKDVFGASDLGQRVEAFCSFLKERGCAYSTVANYVSSLINVASFVYDTEVVAHPSPTPLEQLLNLRGQCESHAKQDRLWKRKDPAWIDFEEAQAARCKAIHTLNAYRGKDHARKLQLHRDVLILSFLTCQPPDRVGIVRKLRVGHTLKRAEAGWQLDLSTKRGQHKTARFYGPTITSIHPLIGEWIDRYISLITFDNVVDDQPYLFPVSGDFSRCVSTSSWSTLVKGVFLRYTGKATPPKTLRASFICWLKSQTDAPDILKAAAVAMKHQTETQASGRYDVEYNDRLASAATSFVAAYASSFEAEASSSTRAPAPAPVESQPRGRVESRVRAPVPEAEALERLAARGWTRGEAAPNGDCFVLSALASLGRLADARSPGDEAMGLVSATREAAVDAVTSSDVAGMRGHVWRASEGLPKTQLACQRALAKWRQPGHWRSDVRHLSSAFHFGVALHLEAPIVVLQLSGGTVLDPATVYGARDGATLRRSAARSKQPETVPTWFAVAFEEVVRMDVPHALLLYNGEDHFDPMLGGGAQEPSVSPPAVGGASLEQALSAGAYAGLVPIEAPPRWLAAALEADSETAASLHDRFIAFHWEGTGWECGRVGPVSAKSAHDSNFDVLYTWKGAAWRESQALVRATYGVGGVGSWVLLDDRRTLAPIEAYQRGKYRVGDAWLRATQLGHYPASLLDAARRREASPRACEEEEEEEEEVSCTVGQRVLVRARGAAGTARFRAVVTAVRALSPRIQVRYEATEDGDTNSLRLPSPLTAFVTSAQLE